MNTFLSNLKLQHGFVLLTTILIMALMLMLALYVISFTLTEFKISTSQTLSMRTYYLAESGVAEAIWRLKNDTDWKINFETDPNWTITYSRPSALYPNGSYQIQVVNSDRARGEITVTGYLNFGNSIAQRVIKTNVYKALGESVVGDAGEYADGNIDMSGTVLRVHNGSIFSNNNIIANFWSIIDVDKNALATGNILTHINSSINAAAKYAHNYPPEPDPIAMPAVSFDNAGDPDSYKARASHIYTTSQFSDLLWNNRGATLTLDGITYVTGDINIYGATDLIINGALVADGNITVGKNTSFCCWGTNCGRSHVIINRPTTDSPSGLLSKGRIDFELCLDSFNAHGLIYANDKINVLSLPYLIDITGGVISRKVTLTSIWQGIDLTFDNEIISYGLGDPQFSPIVAVEHWEEDY